MPRPDQQKRPAAREEGRDVPSPSPLQADWDEEEIDETAHRDDTDADVEEPEEIDDEDLDEPESPVGPDEYVLER